MRPGYVIHVPPIGRFRSRPHLRHSFAMRSFQIAHTLPIRGGLQLDQPRQRLTVVHKSSRLREKPRVLRCRQTDRSNIAM